MNFLNTEHHPDNPEDLPPARRRRAKRLLAPIDADERANFLDELAHQASPSFDFFLLSLISGIVISAGFLLDNSAILVLGAALAPLMSPAIGLSLGTVTGAVPLFIRSLAGLTIGSLLVFLSGWLTGSLRYQYRQRDSDLNNDFIDNRVVLTLTASYSSKPFQE